MVEHEIAAAGVKNPRVLDSMRTTPRHEFMPISERGNAYLDMALPIGDGQTISPPFIVAYMTEQLDPQPTDTVLEIGTGSGYQAAILSPLVKDVYSIEIVKRLGDQAARTLKRLGYKNIHTRVGDGFQGWAEAAPFDKIIVTCSPEKVPQALVDQLREGGRMIVPVGQRYQQTLYLFEKQDGKLKSIALLPTLFVPMTGKAEDNRVVKPDPANPELYNGGFELEVRGIAGRLALSKAAHLDQRCPRARRRALHYVSQQRAGAGRAGTARVGHRWPPGPGDRAFGAGARDRVRPGPDANDVARMLIVFYDEDRRQLAANFLGPWTGTFDWQHDVERFEVPAKAREANVFIGLCGATGELSLDDVRMTPVKKK